MRHGGPHGHGRHGHGDEGGRQGAQTFRRGRALAFLESLNVKRSTFASQLEQPEMQEIRPTILGELKAIEMVRDEFIAMFDLHEFMDEQNTPAHRGPMHGKATDGPTDHRGHDTRDGTAGSSGSNNSSDGTGDHSDDTPESDRDR